MSRLWDARSGKQDAEQREDKKGSTERCAVIAARTSGGTTLRLVRPPDGPCAREGTESDAQGALVHPSAFAPHQPDPRARRSTARRTSDPP